MNRAGLGFGAIVADGTGRSGGGSGPMSHIRRSLVARRPLRIGWRTDGATAPHRIRFRAPWRRGAITPDRLRQDGLI